MNSLISRAGSLQNFTSTNKLFSRFASGYLMVVIDAD